MMRYLLIFLLTGSVLGQITNTDTNIYNFSYGSWRAYPVRIIDGYPWVRIKDAYPDLPPNWIVVYPANSYFDSNIFSGTAYIKSLNGYGTNVHYTNNQPNWTVYKNLYIDHILVEEERRLKKKHERLITLLHVVEEGLLAILLIIIIKWVCELVYWFITTIKP